MIRKIKVSKKLSTLPIIYKQIPSNARRKKYIHTDNSYSKKLVKKSKTCNTNARCLHGTTFIIVYGTSVLWCSKCGAVREIKLNFSTLKLTFDGGWKHPWGKM